MKPNARKARAADGGEGDGGGKRKAPPKTKAGGQSTVSILPLPVLLFLASFQKKETMSPKFSCDIHNQPELTKKPKGKPLLAV